MWAAIIGAVLGIGKNINDSNINKYAANTGQLQSNVDFERSKEAALYKSYQQQLFTMGAIAGVGIIVIIVIIYLNKSNG